MSDAERDPYVEWLKDTPPRKRISRTAWKRRRRKRRKRRKMAKESRRENR